jgi:hypothetical protein
MNALTETRVGNTENLRPWKPGQSGNPNGRPKGTRHKLGEEFLQALQTDFTEHGAEVIQEVREKHPDKYLKVVASVIPQEVNHTVESYDGYSDDDLAAEFLRVAGALQERAGISIGVAAPAGSGVGTDQPLLAADGDAEPEGREEPLG